jgi:hypothetical protein
VHSTGKLLQPPDLSFIQIADLQIFDVEKIILSKAFFSTATATALLPDPPPSASDSVLSDGDVDVDGDVDGNGTDVVATTLANAVIAEDSNISSSSSNNIIRSSSSSNISSSNISSNISSSSSNIIRSSSSSNISSTSETVAFSFIRKRSQGNHHAYGITIVKILPTGEEVELKQRISSRMYHSLSTTAHPSHNVVKQRRYCFQYERQAFVVCEFLEPKIAAGLWTMSCSAEASPSLPPSLQSICSSSFDVADISSRTISLKTSTASTATTIAAN